MEHWSTMGTSSRSSLSVLQLDTILKNPHERHALWQLQERARQPRLQKAQGPPWTSGTQQAPTQQPPSPRGGGEEIYGLSAIPAPVKVEMKKKRKKAAGKDKSEEQKYKQRK